MDLPGLQYWQLAIRRRLWVSLALFVVVVAGTACATNPETQNTSQGGAIVSPIDGEKITEAHIDLIVADLVSAMVQVQELAPLINTLQVSAPRGVFGEKLIESLETVGYGLQHVSEDQGLNYVSYANRSIESNAGYVQDFSVRVGAIELRREYDVVDDKVVPTSIMYVKGTRSLAQINLNKEIFLHQGGQLEFESGVEIESLDETVLSAAVTPVIQVDEQPEVEMQLDEALLDARNNGAERVEVNLLEEKLLYQPVMQAAISFPSEALLLGSVNKSLIKKIHDNFDADTDILFLNACDGSQQQAGGARQRSTRVVEEFLLRGIARQSIVEEGCVEAEYPEGVVTPRMVMVMQRRRAESLTPVKSLASSYPLRPLTLTIPYAAGSTTDFQARIATMLAAEDGMLGQPITILNKPGQDGRAGWSWFAETAVDSGYDIATYQLPQFITQSVRFKTAYNIDTMRPVGNWGADPAVLVVPVNSPFATLRDFLIYARRNAGKVTVAGSGLLSGHHIALLQLEQATGITFNYQNTEGDAQALQQVVTGDMMSGFSNMSDVYRLGNQVRMLAIADLERNVYLPNVPTFRELGVDIDDSSVSMRGIMVPQGTADDIVQVLSSAMDNMFTSPLVKERMVDGGSPMRHLTAQQLNQLWAQHHVSLAKLLKNFPSTPE